MLSSALSSRKRTRDVSWVDVMLSPHLRGLTVNKDEVAQSLEKWGSPSNFLEQTEYAQVLRCQDVGITGWDYQLITAIREMVR